MAVRDPSLQRMRQKLRSAPVRAWYNKRRALVEPVNGILKEQRGMRQFQRRGLSAAAVEWTLALIAYNLTRDALSHFTAAAQLIPSPGTT